MTPLIDGFIYGSSYRMADAAVKVTLLLGLAAVLAMLLRRSSGSVRHLVWALGLGSALLLPFLSWNMPHWRVPYTVPPTHSRTLLDASPPAQAPQPMSGLSARPQATAGAVPVTALLDPATGPQATLPSVSTTAPTAQPAAAPTASVPWAVWILLVWAGGLILVLAQLAQGLLMVSRFERRSVPVTSGPLADAAQAAVVTMGVSRPVSLRLAALAGPVSVPLTYGARRPVVVLPADAPEWPEARVKAALLHEMAHVRRHDWPLQVMAHFARAVYWFNPLVWLAARRLRAEAEAACDDLVLGAGMSAKDYARHLLDVALCARRSHRAGWGAVAMAQSPKVEGRLRAVLAQHSRRPITRRSAACLLSAAMLLALPLAALRLVAQGQAVPAADRLHLHGDFTLRYAVTITDQRTTAAQFREYQQLRAGYQQNLEKDPYFQPVPAEYYAPFSYFQSRRPRTRHVVITVSSHSQGLFYQTVEGDDTYAQFYDGHTTQAFRPGYAGPVNPGRQISMSECPLPAVGLPFLPLLKNAALVGSSGEHQIWQAAIAEVGVAQGQGEAYYMDGLAHAVRDRGEWKLLDTDNTDQRWQFFQHQRFQGLWIASHMRLIKYDTDAPLPPKGKYPNIRAVMDWFKTVRKPSEVSEYRLLSASQVPIDPSTLVKMPPQRYSSGFQDAEDLYLQEAMHLRYHLQGWAMTQKTALRQMAQGGPGARAAARRIDTWLPTLPFPLWSGDPRPDHVWDGDPRVGHTGRNPLFIAERLGPAGAAGDFEIARSRDIRPIHVVLWASGRITRGEREIIPAFYGADGTASMAGDGADVLTHKAARAAPDDADTQGRLAWALYAAYDAQTHRSNSKPWTFGPPAALDKAIQHMQAAVAQRPDEWQLQESLGWFFARRHRWAEAVPHLRRAREMLDASGFVRIIRRAAANGDNSQGPVYNSLYALCDSFVRDGDDKDAALHYMQALIAAQGDAYADAGKYREAEERYQEALQFDSFTSYVVFAQGDALRRGGHRAEARATWKRILSIDPPRTYYYEQVRARLARR